jgi:hypothetical protein
MGSWPYIFLSWLLDGCLGASLLTRRWALSFIKFLIFVSIYQKPTNLHGTVVHYKDMYTIHLSLVIRLFDLRLCGLKPLANLHHHLICALSLSVLTPFGWLCSVTRTPNFWWACNFLFTPTLSGTHLGRQTRSGCVFMACVRPDRYSRARRNWPILCNNVSLGLWTSVSLTAAKFKPLNAVCVGLRIDP